MRSVSPAILQVIFIMSSCLRRQPRVVTKKCVEQVIFWISQRTLTHAICSDRGGIERNSHMPTTFFSMTGTFTRGASTSTIQRKVLPDGLEIFPRSAIHRNSCSFFQRDDRTLSYAAVIYKVLHPSFNQTGYRRTFSFHFLAYLAGRPDSFSQSLRVVSCRLISRGEHV